MEAIKAFVVYHGWFLCSGKYAIDFAQKPARFADKLKWKSQYGISFSNNLM